jgi:hypothetical protein
MSKKLISTYKFVPGIVTPDTALYPNCTTLLEANKKFLQEETIAYIQYNSSNNIAPFVYYTYNADKCRRDVSYVLEGYISDLKHGGNKQTVHNAQKYFENGIPQVDGDRQPEIAAHTFIKNLVQNFVLANIVYSARNTTITQTTLPISAEALGKTKLSELNDIIVNVITNGLTSLPAISTNRGYVKFPGFYKLKDILLITNTSRNIIMYNFADPSYKAEVTYYETADSDFPGALYGTDKITTVTFDIDTSAHMVTDNIQIYVSAKSLEVRLNPIGTDAMERQKVGIPQSMLDADFEYGLQPTKWQAISMMRNYPAVYEIPSSDISVVNVITDASTSTGNTGASLITVTTLLPHGLVANSPFTIKALANSINGFSRAEGTFLVNTVPDSTTFTYYSKSKVGTSNGQVLASTYTQLRKGAYYTGASVGNPAFSVYSAGSSGSITSVFSTDISQDRIGFTGTLPPLGAPIAGTGIPAGAQITAINGPGGTGATTSLTTTANIGDTSIIVDSTASIVPGMVIDRGDGTAVQVADITGNTVSLSGALTAQTLGSTQSYANLTQSATNGTGSGGVFTVSRTASGYITTVTNPGGGYLQGDICTILGTNLGGITPTNNATITITSASNKNTVATFDSGTLLASSTYNPASTSNLATTGGNGTGLTVDVVLNGSNVPSAVIVNNPGKNYTVGSTVTVLSGVTRGVVLSTGIRTQGTGYTTTNNVAVSGGSGTGLTVDIEANPVGGVRQVNITNAGTGYTNTQVTVTTLTGTGSGMVVSIGTSGGSIISISINNQGSGYTVGSTVRIPGGGNNAALTITGSVTNAEVTNVTINNPGQNYVTGETVTIPGGTGSNFQIGNVTADATIQIASVNTGGVILAVSTSGTTITAPTKNFISAITISDLTTATIPASTTLSYSAIATVEVAFTTAHGFVPGNTITSQITSTDTGAQLAAGAYFVENVPTPTTLRYTARTSGTIANTLTGILYARPDSFFIHRPFDGGVQLGTASPSHGAAAIRMSKKYIRYQSGKGVMYNTGALFAPSYDLRSLTATGTTAGNIITVTTDDTDHGCQVGSTITISGVTTSGYNNVYTVQDIINERVLTIIAKSPLGTTSAQLGNPCQMTVRTWHGSTVRAGIFDDQNGMFWQYDGQKMAVVQRSSTFQIAGTIAIAANSNLVTGNNTRFLQQLAAGDRVVIRGMSHIITSIASETSMTVAPDYRGVNNATEVKIVKTVDKVVPQEYWNGDACNGSGQSGYNLDVTKMQMIGIQHTWYGAGFIDFMLRGSEGNYIFVHRFRNSNVNTEAYMRTGNQPVRYDVTNDGARGKLREDMNPQQTYVPLVAGDAYWFPNSGTIYIDSEMIRYTGNDGLNLTGCVRGSTLTQFAAGSQRTFSGGVAANHLMNTGAVLISNTITPNISHWGSAFMIDGQFDSDRGYIFNYAATGVSVSVDKKTAFLMRLAPSVSNAQIGDLGDKELLNRAQLLMSQISITSDSVAGGGAIVVEGVINPSNYPDDPTKITWVGLNSAAAGGQPSFTQIANGGSVSWGGGASTSTATIQGAFTTTLTAKSFSPITTTFTATSFSTITQNLTATSFGTTSNTSTIIARGNLSATFGATYANAVNTARRDIMVLTTDYDSYILTNTMSVGDSLISSPTNYFALNTKITGVNRAYLGTAYTQITFDLSPTSTVAGTGNLTTTVTLVLGATYNQALSTLRTDFLITNTQYNGFTSTPLAIGDRVTVATYLTGTQVIQSITPSYVIINGTSYTRIVMSSAANASSPVAASNGAQNITVVDTNALSVTFAAAIASTRATFLVPQTQAASTSAKVNDVLSVATYLAGGQTLSSITQNYATLSGTVYALITMSGVGTLSSTTGTGNNLTITVTSADTSTYGRALSAGRVDFLITNTEYDASGILAGDVLSVATYLTGGQTVISATRSYTTISSVAYTRIVMSAVANSNSTAGSGNDITVTVTAAGSAASYASTNYLFFTSASWTASNAIVGTRVASDQTQYPSGTSVSTVSTRTFGATTVYRVVFTQSANTTQNAAATVKFQFGANYALPGEQVFSFLANPGNTERLELDALKELTSTAIGGRGTFPNGPDVLAINVYKVSGSATPANLTVRWSEAQA